MMSMNTHLKCALGFSGVFDTGFLLIFDIWHDVQKGSVSSLSLISWQTFSVYPAISNLMDPCPNIWCNNYKGTLFLGICFCDFDFSFVFTKDKCFLCKLCDNVTAFCSLSPKKTVQNPLWKRGAYPKLTNLIMENNQSHKSGENSMLYNAEMKGLPLSSHMFIWTSPFFPPM